MLGWVGNLSVDVDALGIFTPSGPRGGLAAAAMSLSVRATDLGRGAIDASYSISAPPFSVHDVPGPGVPVLLAAASAVLALTRWQAARA